MLRKTSTAIAVTTALTLSACAGSSGYDFNTVTEECEIYTTTAYSRILDDGAGYAVNTRGEETHGVEFHQLLCVLTSVETPESVIARMDSTRAMDGMQTAEWDGVEASWTYHPKDGLSVIFEAK